MSEKTACCFCVYEGRSDNLRNHYSARHSDPAKLEGLASPRGGRWHKLEGSETLFACLRRDGADGNYGYCLGCHEIFFTDSREKNVLARIAAHTCKPKQTRNRQKGGGTPRRSRAVTEVAETLENLRKRYPVGMSNMIEIDERDHTNVAKTLENMAAKLQSPAVTGNAWEAVVTKLRGKTYRTVNGKGTVSQIKMTEIIDEVISGLYSHDDDDDEENSDSESDGSHTSETEPVDYEQVFDCAMTLLTDRIKQASR